MKKINDFFNRISLHLNQDKYSRSNLEYSVAYSMIGAFLILLKGLFSLIFTAKINFTNYNLYLLYVIVVSLIFIIMLLIHLEKLSIENKIIKIFVKSMPVLIVTICIFMMFLYSVFLNQILSFIIIMVIISWLQTYKNIKRLLIYLYSFALFNALSLIILSQSSYSYDYLIFSFMAIVLGFITSSIHSKVYSHQKSLILELNDNDKRTASSIKELENSNTALKQSNNITAAMLKLTQEVLKNEKIGSVLQLVLDEAMNLIPNSQAGSILILREEQKMEFIAARGYSLEKLRKVSLQYEDLYQATFEDPYKPTIIENLKVFDEIHLSKEKSKAIFAESVNVAKSCLTCSFKFEDKFYGSINIDNFDSTDVFKENDLYLIKQLSKELEIIISIHNLYEKAIRPTKFDELTEAHTRTYTMKKLRELIRSGKCERISICTIDVNQLKSINDRFGHDVGDKYLSYFADSIRNADITENVFGRVGGDEFLLIFCGLNQEETLKQIKTIKKFLKDNKFVNDDYKGEITFAAGVSVLPDDGEEIIELIKLSDKRMYEDKREQKK